MEKKTSEITNLKEIQKLELDILDEVVKFCQENNLKYMLAYGTLLGAVRHKGFIPWDDDVDILMPRKDYQKFIELWNDEGKYKLLECRKNKEYIYPFAKVYNSETVMEEHDVEVRCQLGLYIDIFPIDSIKGTPEESKKFVKKCEMLEKFRLYSMMSVDKIMHENHKKNFGRKTLWKILRKIGPSKIARYIDKYSQKYNSMEAKWVGCLCSRTASQKLFPYKTYNDVRRLEFEDKEYNAPVEFDVVLQKIYGDYMQLPPKEEQHLTHNFRVWKVDKE